MMPDEYATLETVVDQMPRFALRPDAGDMAGVVERLSRYLMGNPIKYFNVQSANAAAFTALPDEPRAQAAVCQVIGQPIAFRTDATNPAAANEQTAQPGAIITLTGWESIKGFIFASAGAAAAFLAINYYD